MVSPGGLRYVLRMTQPEEKEVLRRLCNLAMKITAEREARQAKANEANTDKDGKGDRVKDEKVHNVWTNVHLNGRSINVKQAGYRVFSNGLRARSHAGSRLLARRPSICLQSRASRERPTRPDRVHRLRICYQKCLQK